MADYERLAELTCGKFMTAAQLKTLCRSRGFPIPSGPKDALVTAVSVRLLSTTGAAEAMAALPEEWQVALHALAFAESPLGLGDLHAVLFPKRDRWNVDYRRLFSKVADGLLTSGVVLVLDGHLRAYPGQSRYARIAFDIPDPLRPFLPPFPVPTAPMREGRSGDGPGAFAKAALARSARLTALEMTPGDDLLDRVATSISFRDGTLGLGGRPLAETGRLLARIREAWASGESGKGVAEDQSAARRAAAHVLAHLPPGEGVTRSALGRAVKRLGCSPKLDWDKAFLAEGVEAGLLLEDGGPKPLYRAAPDPEEPGGGPLSFLPTEHGIRVEVGACGLGALLEIASLSNVRPRAASILLEPDPVRLGRAVDRLASLPALSQVLDGSPAYVAAVELIRRRAGKTLLHSWLAVLRIDDPILLVTLTHRLPDSVRPLGGPWLAALAGAVPKVVSVAEREGYKPRRIS